VHLLLLTEWLTPSLPTFCLPTLAFFPCSRSSSPCYLIPTFVAHRVLCLKTTMTMPPRRTSQRLHPNEGSTQTSDQNQTHHPSTQDLPTIAEGAEHLTFDTIPQVQLQPANMATTAAGSSQNGGAASSTQTNGGPPHQTSPRPPLLVQVIHNNLEFDQIQVQDWNEEAKEIKAAVEEEELVRVQQEIKRLRQEQESIMRHQAIAQRAEARRQRINRERAWLAELQYTVDALCHQEQRQQPNANPPPPNYPIPPPPPPNHYIPHHQPPSPPHNQYIPPSPHFGITDPRSPLPTTYNMHHVPRITETLPYPSITEMLTIANFSCPTKQP
jgi:hypothetical protein